MITIMNIECLERDPSWYAGPVGWMLNVSVRRDVLNEIRNAITLRRADDQTITELLQLLDHEYLSIQYGPSPVPTNPQQSWTDELLDQVSQCLVLRINGPTPFERELLLRALLSILNLIRVQGTGHNPAFHYNLLSGRLREELGHVAPCVIDNSAEAITTEQFRSAQCSYLLPVVMHHAHFLKSPLPPSPLPQSVTVRLERWIACTVKDIGWNVQADTAKAFRALERELHTYWQQPAELMIVLLGYQELCRICLALHRFAVSREAHIASQSRRSTASVTARSFQAQNVHGLTKLVLENLLRVVADDNQFSLDPQPMSPLEPMSATLPPLNASMYLYGFLDCTRQLSKVMGSDYLPLSLLTLMKRVIATTSHRRLRWKAIEILLSKVSDGDSCLKIIGSASEGHQIPVEQPIRQQLRDEIRAIKRCIIQEQGHYKRQRRSSNAFSVSSSLVPNDGPKCRFRPDRWVEHGFQSLERSPTVPETMSVELERPHKSKFLKGFGSRVDCISAGLSPNCEVAFLLHKSHVMLYDVRNLRPKAVVRSGANLPCQNEDMKEAVLSDSFLAFISGSGLTVHEYSLPLWTVMVGRPHVFEEEEGSQWDPSCLSIHEEHDRVWLAIGGGIIRGRNFHGDIKIFHINKFSSNKKLLPQEAKFRRSKPDPLIGPLKGLSFSPDKGKLICITNNNDVLIWPLSNNSQPRGSPFKIERYYNPAMAAYAVTSTTVFFAPSTNPYVLTTTSPSFQRASNNARGEWSYISAVAPCPAELPEALIHDITNIQGKILVGTVTTNGGLVAILEKSGKIKILRLTQAPSGGLRCEPQVDEGCNIQLCSSLEKASPTSLRFEEGENGLYIVAVDTRGTLIRHRWTDSPVRSVLPTVLGPPAELYSVEMFPLTTELPTPTWAELPG